MIYEPHKKSYKCKFMFKNTFFNKKNFFFRLCTNETKFPFFINIIFIFIVRKNYENYEIFFIIFLCIIVTWILFAFFICWKKLNLLEFYWVRLGYEKVLLNVFRFNWIFWRKSKLKFWMRCLLKISSVFAEFLVILRRI